MRWSVDIILAGKKTDQAFNQARNVLWLAFRLRKMRNFWMSKTSFNKKKSNDCD